LRAAQDAAAYGFAAALDAARTELGRAQRVAVDYLTVTDPELGPVADPLHEPTEARVLVAARLGTTRLIDNMPLVIGTAAPGTEGQD
jgi:pantoate--beta-alanine ligase